MAVTILRYPGGLEYPELWKNNIQGLTPIDSYTLSDEQALARFPGLAYTSTSSAQPQTTAPITTTSYADIKVAGPETPGSQFNDDQFYQYEQDLDSYNKTIKAAKQKQFELDKTVEDKRAVYLSGLTDPAAIQAAYKELQGAIQASSDYAISNIGKFRRPTTPTNYKPTGRPLFTPVQTTSPETQKNLEIVQEQAATGNVDSKQFLDSYVASAEPVVAQNQGPSTPVKYDEQMKQFVPNPGAGRPGEVRLKNPPFPLAQDPFKNSPRTGPGLSERESRAVDVAIRTPDEQKASQAFQSEYDPQKARAAASAAKEYKKQFQAEDPFRSNAFG